MASRSTRGKADLKREIVTSLRLSPEEHEKLRRLAFVERRSLSNQLRHLLAQAPDADLKDAA
jgi:hypothetical protein